jgi:putative DNA primase/helicase
MAALIGHENVAGPRLSALGTNFGLEPLIGKPLAIIGDALISKRTDTAPIIESMLSISGEDRMTIDRKHKGAWTGRLQSRLMILTNELPSLINESGALAARLLVWKFVTSFEGREDRGLDAKLAAELPGIFNWAVEGYQRLRERGYFVQAPSGVDILEQFRSLTAPIRTYVQERVVVEEGSEVDVRVIFADWCTWCEARRRKSGDDSGFGRLLRIVFPGLKTGQRRGDKNKGEDPKLRVSCYQGFRLKTPEDDQEQPAD